MEFHTKKCFKCGEEKEISLFYKHPKMADGHLNKCIACTKQDSKNHRKDHPEYYEQFEKSRKNLSHRRELADRIRDEYREAYPERYKAYSMVNYAVRSGSLKKTACVCCGESKVTAHHVAYDLPLDVVWLCQKHHKETHANLKEY